MSAAKKQRNDESGDERVDLFIAPYQSEYSDAISAAREAAATTATPAWQANYRNNIEAHRKAIKEAIESIEGTCQAIEVSDTYEEAEKDIGKAVKRLAEERIRFGAWRTRAVQEYEESASNCQGIIATALRRATDDERNSPLINIGLLLAVKARLDTWPRAEWNDESGVVTVADAKS